MKTPSIYLKALIANPYAWMIAITLIWLPMSLYSLTSYPAPYSDEAWVGSISATFLKTGHFDVPIFAGSTYKDYSIFRLYNVGLALFFRLWGVGLMQGRAFSMVGALVSGWLLFLLGRRLYGPLAGLLAMTLYLFSLRVLWLGHVVRPDMWVNVGGLACFLAFWHVRKSRQAWQVFALGALAAGVVDIYLTHLTQPS